MRNLKTILLIVLSALLLAACGGGNAPAENPPGGKNASTVENPPKGKDASSAVNSPEDLPEEASAFLLQSAKSSLMGNVYVTGLSGKYSSSDGFTNLSEEAFTFKLAGGDGGFIGYFWEKDMDGASSRTQYYGASSFWNSYYDYHVEKDIFHPTACWYQFNENGDMSELNECADLSYSQPDEPEEPEKPEKSEKSKKTKEPEEQVWQDMIAMMKESGGIELLAEDADLSNAPDIVVEPDAPPFNLGGWKENNSAAWEFDVTSNEGEYAIYIYYSRPLIPHYTEATLTLSTLDGSDSLYSIFSPPDTSDENDDWSVYRVEAITSAYFEKGSYRLEIQPGLPDDWTTLPEYFINLRSVILVPISDTY